MHQRIDRIRKLRLENTQIVSAAYESGGEFCRVVWETSFGKGSLINSEIWAACRLERDFCRTRERRHGRSYLAR